METAVMSSSLVVSSDVDETITEVLTQLVLEGEEQAQTQISVKLLQEQVELHLGYSAGSLNSWHSLLSSRTREFFRGVQPKNPASV
jgi:hypothetical protein